MKKMSLHSHLFLISFIILSASKGFSQSVGIGISTPNSSAQLDISTTSKGLLIPRMETSQIPFISNPAKGLMVYDSVKNQLVVNMGSSATPNWQNIVFTSGWSLTGNSGINPATQFIGTTDASPIKFRFNNVTAGLLDSAFQNTSFGFRTLDSITIGTGNVAIGYKALFNDSSGFANTAVGANALRFNAGGANNTATGASALQQNAGGGFNTANGAFALQQNSNAFNNTAIGTTALQNNTQGSDNTATGSEALRSNQNGNKNTAMGTGSLYTNTGSNNTANGYRALFYNSSGYTNTAMGSEALMNNTMGYQNTAVGYQTLLNNTTGYQNTAIGSNAEIAAGSTNTTVIGVSALAMESNMMAFGNTLVSKWSFGRSNNDFDAALQVGIAGTPVPNGSGAYLSRGGIWTNTSDENLKENFVALDGKEILNKIEQLRITKWDYKGTRIRETHIGPMAEQFKQLFGLGVESDRKSISTTDPSGIALAGIQELSKLAREQQQMILSLQKQVDELKNLVNELMEVRK